MGEHNAMVLLDDARKPEGGGHGSDALLYEAPRAIFAAHRHEDVSRVLAEAEAALTAGKASGEASHLAGYLGYEAGLALEERLAPLADERSGAAGPLVWLGLFGEPEVIPASSMPEWLAQRVSDQRSAETGTSAAALGAQSIGPLEPAISKTAYDAAFNRLQQAIAAGDIYQANLTFPLAGGFSGDPLALYAALRPVANAGYGGAVFDGSHWLLSFSPELFVAIKDGHIKAKPMKGTRPRGSDPQHDAALKKELANSAKDRAENLMIADLLRNDLSRIAEPGSVRVEAPFAIESYPTVHQMVTTVKAQLGQGITMADMLRAIFPCGSITGAPKIRAMELIHEVERDARGPYCGAIGRIAPPDDHGHFEAAFNVAIRTLRLTEIENGRGKAVLGVGGAIVADSEADVEWREAIIKSDFLRAKTPDEAAIDGTGHEPASHFDLIETMRFDPEVGIYQLEAHLARMKESAAALGFQFDRHETRNQLHALCFDLTAPSRLRLRAARSGAIALETAPLESHPPSSLAPAADGGAMGDSETPPVTCILVPLPVDEGDWRLRHKTSDRGFYEAAREMALAAGAAEALFLRPDGLLTEGSFTNIFVKDERGMLITPEASLGLLPGIERSALLASGKAREGKLRESDLANGFFIGNAVRGLMPARLLPSETAQS